MGPVEPFFGPFLGYPPQISKNKAVLEDSRRGRVVFPPQKGRENHHILHLVCTGFFGVIGVDIDTGTPPGTPPGVLFGVQK